MSVPEKMIPVALNNNDDNISMMGVKHHSILMQPTHLDIFCTVNI